MPRYAKILLTLFIVFSLVAGASYFALQAFLPKINTVQISEKPEEIGIIKEEEIQVTGESAAEYVYAREHTLNILLLGVDKAGYEHGRSDTMVLVTLEQGSPEIKMTSFLRDTFSYIPQKDRYEKLNHNHSYGGENGPVETMKAINMNYDLNIEDFVEFDWDALIDLVNAIGGIDITLDEVAFADFNSIVEVEAWMRADKLEQAGPNHLNGKQALLYARIRQNSGGDEARTSRQREVLLAIFKRVKTLSKSELVDIARKLIPDIRTSYSYWDILKLIDYYDEIKGNAVIKEATFPFFRKDMYYNEIFYKLPVTVEANVKKLHEYIYGIKDYTLSRQAQQYADHIKELFRQDDRELTDDAYQPFH